MSLEQDIIDTISGDQALPNSPTEPTNNTPTEPVVKTDTPPTPAPNAEPTKAPETPTFNLAEELQKTTNGEVKSAEELSEILTKYKGLSELEAKLKTYEEENTSLKASANTNPFANDTVKKLNEFYSKGVSQNTIDAFLRINKVENIDDLQPLEARKLELQIKDGLTAEEAEDYLGSLYKLKADDEEDLDELTKVRQDAIRLKVESNQSKEFLKTHKAEVSKEPIDNSAKLEQDRQAEYQKILELITPIAKSVVNEVEFKGININGKDGEASIKMDLEFTPESKAQMEANLMNIVKANPQVYPNTEEGKQQLKQVAENMLVLQNWKKWVADATNSTDKRVRAEYHNPSTPNRGDDNPNKGKTSNEELADWVLQNS